MDATTISDLPMSAAQPLDFQAQPSQPTTGPPTRKSGPGAEVVAGSGVFACRSLASSAKSSTHGQAPQPGRGTGLFQEGLEISSGFYLTSLRARRLGRTAEHGEARDREPVESLLQAANFYKS